MQFISYIEKEQEKKMESENYQIKINFDLLKCTHTHTQKKTNTISYVNFIIIMFSWRKILQFNVRIPPIIDR